MHDLEGSESEKRLSRRLFEAALQAELAEVVAEFKVRAAGVTTAEDMWAIVCSREACSGRSHARGTALRPLRGEAVAHRADRLSLNPAPVQAFHTARGGQPSAPGLGGVGDE